MKKENLRSKRGQNQWKFHLLSLPQKLSFKPSKQGHSLTLPPRFI